MPYKDLERRREYQKEYSKRLEVRARKKKYQEGWRKKNKDKIVKQRKENYQKNKKEILKQKKEYQQRPEVKVIRREYQKKYSQKNRGKMKEYQKEYQRKYIKSENGKKVLKEYRQEHKDEIRKQRKEYYNDNKEMISRKEEEFYQKNKDKIKVREREYYKNNKEKILKQGKEYYQSNKGKIKEYNKEYRQKLIKEENKRRKKLRLPLIGEGWISECEMFSILKKIIKNLMIKHDRKVLGGLELDAYFPELKLAFEYMGIQHYEWVKFFHKTKEEFEVQQYNDKCTKKICKMLGITLIRIKYDEDLSGQLILSKLKNFKFPITQKKI